MRILVVEDEKILCQQIQSFFTQKGYAVDIACTGKDGYYFAKEFSLDAVIARCFSSKSVALAGNSPASCVCDAGIAPDSCSDELLSR